MTVATAGLTRHYGDVHALDDVDVTLTGDTVHGLLGASGAGKTTLLRILAGQEFASAGTVTGVGATVCLVREDQTYPDTYRVGHALRAAALLQPHWSEEVAHDLVTRFGLPLDRRTRKLSRGQRSMLGATIGVASRASLTLLDEPYLGLDARSRAVLSQVLMADYAEHPRTIVLSSHLIDEVADLLEHVVVLDRGRVVLDDDVDALRGRAVTVSGPVESVERFVAGCGELHREQLGPTLRVTAVGTPAAVPAELDVSPVSLQQLIVHTASAPDADQGRVR
ncbi:ATP-binding cassette domain-containing protein [Pseudonocardia abyssalis]|uniref:ABC transporter ATP-binding protein n=1 Tax=Pseudonocardia abyssalis TaxID=2792008 RepID=A0ABS6UWU8_9PSEU|nr:ABC transporter ATP-binding protein [Pseudonocardia abyssalis]MBW0115503.1 ABC transporter ATP-binding protein [Pseudonocardia abyssalis]MBW0136701.1 ABC transporter ATP-binding protein [Pseudonocardia abyssalis]